MDSFQNYHLQHDRQILRQTLAGDAAAGGYRPWFPSPSPPPPSDGYFNNSYHHHQPPPRPQFKQNQHHHHHPMAPPPPPHPQEPPLNYHSSSIPLPLTLIMVSILLHLSLLGLCNTIHLRRQLILILLLLRLIRLGETHLGHKIKDANIQVVVGDEAMLANVDCTTSPQKSNQSCSSVYEQEVSYSYFSSPGCIDKTCPLTKAASVLELLEVKKDSCRSF